MSRFKRIKDKSTKKSSVSIDEKIAALNKELEKTGMLSEKMTTSNVYSTSTFVPADPGGEFPIPDTTGVTGSGFTQPVSGDPDDPSNWPNAFTDNSWMRNSNTVNGEANQPIIASFDDALFATDSSGRYPTGGAGIAFGNQAFGVSVGYIRNGFYRQVLKPGLLGGTVTVPQDASGAPYFGLFGEYFPADETRQKILKMASARYNAVVGSPTIPVKAWTPHNTFHMGPFADYSGPKVTVDGQNYVLQTFQMYTKSNTFYVNATPATTTNPIFRGIGDIEYHGPITPGRLFGLSNQGYNYLDGRSRKKKEDEGTFDADGNYIPPGFENAIGTDEIGDTTPEPETDEEDLTPADIPDEFKTDSRDKPSAKGVTLTKWVSRTDFMKLYPDSTMSEYLSALPYGPTNFMKPDPNFPGARIVDTAAYERYFMTGDTSGLSGEPRHTTATPEPEQKMYGGKTYEELMADLDATIEKYSAMEKEAYAEMRSIALELGIDFVSLIGGLFTGGTTAYPVLSKLGLKLLRKYGKTVAGKMIRKLIKRFRTKKNSQKLDELLDDIDNGRPPKPKDKLPDDMEYVWSDTGKGNEKGWNVRFKEKSTKIPPKPKDKLPDDMEYVWSDTGKGNEKGWNVRFKEKSTKTPPKPNDPLDPLPDTHEFKWDGNQWVARRKVGTNNTKTPPKPKEKLPDGFNYRWDPKGGSDGKGQWVVRQESFKTNGALLTEAAKLGHFEPEELNVDIEKLRKGIMPEYPKKPPAKMVDGYHQDSQLKPKELNKEPYLKISEKDLIRNHRLKPNEAQEMMQTIDRINDHIKEHPEDLIHAQMRYPIDDPRLAELNWKMDQMLEAGEEYLDSNFKVNDKLFKRAVDRTKNNIKLTDPEYVQQHYDELRGTTQGKVINPKPRDIKLKSKLKKHLPQYESKSFFRHVDSNDFKKISERKEEQKRLKLANETALNKVTKDRQEYIDGEMLKQMSDWRKDISESDFTNITQGNKIGQTFQHASGAIITLDNTMSDPSDLPSQVTLDLGFGEKITVDAPSGNEYGIAGITSHLGASGGGIKELDKKVMQKQNVKTAGEINQQLDASEKASGAESARVDNSEKTDEYYKNRQKSGYYTEKLGSIHGAMTDLHELKMNEKLVQENERQHEIYKKNDAIRAEHQKVIDKKIKPHLDKINSGLDKKIDLRTLYQRGAVVNDDGTRGLMIRRETKSAMGLSLTKTVITSYRGKNLSTVGSVANREKLGITGQGKMTKVAEIKDPRLIEYKMPEELEMWQSQSVDPRGALTRSAGAQVAKAGVKSAFDVLNYYIDNHVLTYAQHDPARANVRHNLTHLITNRTKDILRKGMDKLAADGKLNDDGNPIQRGIVRDNVNQYFKQHGVLGDNKLAAQLQKVDIYNSLGNDLGFDVEHYNKTGNYQFNSTYKFTSTLDMGVRLPVAGAIISALSRKYVSGQLHGETMMAVQNPMQFQVDIESGKQYTPSEKEEPDSKQPISKEPSKVVKTIKKMTKTKSIEFDRDDVSFKKKKKEK